MSRFFRECLTRMCPGSLPALHRAHLEGRCPVEQVGEVKVLDVVAGDDVWVCGPYKLRPALRTQKINKTQSGIMMNTQHPQAKGCVISLPISSYCVVPSAYLMNLATC